MTFDTVITAVNAANVRLNGKVDTLQAIGGQLIGNTDAFSNQAVNNAWRKLQNRLADSRFADLQTEILFLDVGQTGSIDPIALSYIDTSGFFNGVGNSPVPALPAGFIRPYGLTERQNGTAALFTEMDEIQFQLPRVPKANWNRQWLWRNNRLYLPGALVATDIAMVYAQLLADFVDGNAPWFQATIPILNCVDALADYICCEISIARGDAAGAAAFQLSAEQKADLVANRDTTAAKSVAKTSELGKMGTDMDRVRR